jgi:hypothetical protein
VDFKDILVKLLKTIDNTIIICIVMFYKTHKKLPRLDLVTLMFILQYFYYMLIFFLNIFWKN